MKKYFFVTLLFLLLFPFAIALHAQDGSSVSTVAPSIIGPSPDYQPNTFLGQNHTYSIVFRGNGEAVVSARIVAANSTDQTMKELKLRIPKVTASGIYVFQIFKQKTCIRYDQAQYDSATKRYLPAECLEYQDPDYYNDYSYYNAKYKKADFDYKNDTLTISIPEAIGVNKAGAFFVYFRALGYAKKNAFGAYDYTFESLQAEDYIRSLNIGINTDSDLFMKGVSGEVNYRFQDLSPTVSKLGVGGGAELGGAPSTALDSYITSIGQGSIHKSASNLAPLETYKVQGAYANSRAKLYGKEIMIGIIVALLVVAILVAIIVALVRLLKKTEPPQKKEVSEKVTETPRKVGSVSGGKMFAVITLIGFVDSLIITMYTAFVFILTSFISKGIMYPYQTLVTFVIIILSILVYVLLIVSPGILLGVKKGVGWGLGVVVSTILWLIFWVIVVFLIIFLFGKSGIVRNVIQPFPDVVY